jgi:hypothetical protein
VVQRRPPQLRTLASSDTAESLNQDHRFADPSVVTRTIAAGFFFAVLLVAAPAAAVPPTGNPTGTAPVPTEAQAVDTSSPDVVIGNGTAASCTSAAVVSAVAQGGTITFDCGPNPVTIVMNQTAKVVNDTGPEIVIDGGGTVTLSGAGVRRILYMNTCDKAQMWTTSHCQNQDHPRLTVQNLTFVDGDATGETVDGGGGGAIFVRGGRFKIVNSRFFNNTCDPAGTDVGGGAVRVLSQYNGLPVYVVNSTFGGAPGYGNGCANGGGLSSIGVSWTVLNSLFTHNRAIGTGANSGYPGGGNGGAIYNDGNTMTLTVRGTRMENNVANEGGGAIFFVSNNRTGHLVIDDSVLSYNPSLSFETNGYPGIFYLGSGPPLVTGSLLGQYPIVPDLCEGPEPCDTVMVQDPGGRFHVWSAMASDHSLNTFYYGNPGDTAFSGDWNCDGVDTPGLYRASDGYVYLRNSRTQGVADISFFFGNPGDLPLAGDFDGDGCDTVSVYRPSQARIYVINELGSGDQGLGAADFSFLFGNPGDRPFVGDFNGNGRDTVGLHRASTGLVYFRNTLTTGIADHQFIYGDPGDLLVAGDWNGDGVDTVAVYRPSNGLLYVKNTNTQGYADAAVWAGSGLTGVAVAVVDERL